MNLYTFNADQKYRLGLCNYMPECHFENTAYPNTNNPTALLLSATTYTNCACAVVAWRDFCCLGNMWRVNRYIDNRMLIF